MNNAINNIKTKKIPEEFASLINLKMHYANRAFAPICESLFDFVNNKYNSDNAYLELTVFYSDLLDSVGSLATIVDFVRDTRESGKLVEYYGAIKSDVMRNINCSISEIMFSEIDSIQLQLDTYMSVAEIEPSYKPIFETWVQHFNDIPNKDWCELEGNGYITDESFDEITESVDVMFDFLLESYNTSREDFVDELLRLIISTGVKLNNALYRDIYDCFRILKLIDSGQIKSHDITAQNPDSKYVREQYIKQTIKRLQKKKGSVCKKKN